MKQGHSVRLSRLRAAFNIIAVTGGVEGGMPGQAQRGKRANQLQQPCELRSQLRVEILGIRMWMRQYCGGIVGNVL